MFDIQYSGLGGRVLTAVTVAMAIIFVLFLLKLWLQSFMGKLLPR